MCVCLRAHTRALERIRLSISKSLSANVPRKHRFSGTKKLIVGVGSTSTVVQVVESASDVWCFYKAGPFKQSPKVVAENIVKVLGILAAGQQTLVAIVALFIFWSFALLIYLRSLPLRALLIRARAHTHKRTQARRMATHAAVLSSHTRMHVRTHAYTHTNAHILPSILTSEDLCLVPSHTA